MKYDLMCKAFIPSTLLVSARFVFLGNITKYSHRKLGKSALYCLFIYDI